MEETVPIQEKQPKSRTFSGRPAGGVTIESIVATISKYEKFHTFPTRGITRTSCRGKKLGGWTYFLWWKMLYESLRLLTDAYWDWPQRGQSLRLTSTLFLATHLPSIVPKPPPWAFIQWNWFTICIGETFWKEPFESCPTHLWENNFR